MADLDKYQSAINVKISDDNSSAVVTNVISGIEQGLVVRNIPTSGLIQPVAETPDSSNAFTPTADNPEAYESFSVSKNSAGVLYGFSGYNSSEANLFVQVHNSSNIPTSGAIPIILAYAPSQNNFFWDGSKFGMYFTSGITWCCSITGPTYTPDIVTSGSLWINLMYK